ncbi:thioredoxin-dependent thiol peroxidase [Ohtaekwangia koreensis]|uniref:thioredoxin-dependent peroxiredoxin n=1 Tax=Ohtaekwangia koreensis TaxID=688867 RepID=A0A1T5K9C2_9BACT|nr:thioredoxin-dependent thiol peroxidase [Ohtaekwangia koreensis]SKC60297.1 peroxiredoxin Q/BCP [Ohtaekwangia koreensis]
MALQIGSKAPDFAINDQDGKTVKLSDFKGKKLVLYFYPKDMTPGCTAEACDLRDNYKLLQKQGYEVLGVSTDTEKLHKKFIEKEKLPFRLLADVDKKLHDAYGTWVEKSMYGRKYMGTARVTFIINEKGIIEDIVEKVDTKNHTSQILKDGNVSAKAPAKKTVSKAVVKAVAKKAISKTTVKTKKAATKKK